MLNTILIIDDDQLDRETVKRALLKNNPDINILEADTGETGLLYFNNKDIDISCAFIDYMLPDMDGLEILKRTYNTQLGQGPCATVMMTGEGSSKIMMEALSSGAQDYIVKEFITPATLDVALLKAQRVYDLMTSRREMEDQLLQAQKMEAVGQLTGGIAHDFNNLLTIIFGHSQIMENILEQSLLAHEAPSSVEQLKNNLTSITKSAARGADLVKRLMLFSRSRELAPRNIELGVLIYDISDLLQRCLGETIELDINIQDMTWHVFIDSGQLEHALINMSVNARDAMPNGGKLTIQTTNIHTDKEFSLLHPELERGEYVLLEIADNGNGMNEQTKKKIFDPFFTTKDVGKGTGLGLSVVYSLIKQSGGIIHVQSVLNQGTVFKIYLPRSANDALSTQPRKRRIQSYRGGEETILLVEDEAEIRDLTTMLLEQQGYNIIQAPNGNDALEQLENNLDEIDLLFSDVVMPGNVSGIQLANHAIKIKPSIRIVLTTGYADHNLPEFEDISRFHVLKKPYDPVYMTQTIRQTLDEAVNANTEVRNDQKEFNTSR